LDRGIPGFRARKAGLVERNTYPIAYERILGTVLVPDRRPFTRKIILGKRRRGQRERTDEQNGSAELIHVC
jgi:hypothetical protein